MNSVISLLLCRISRVLQMDDYCYCYCINQITGCFLIPIVVALSIEASPFALAAVCSHAIYYNLLPLSKEVSVQRRGGHVVLVIRPRT